MVKEVIWKHFSKEEFACPCGECENGINYSFISLLDELREILGFPIHINSGYRCPEHNKTVGGVEDSAHTKGLAADLKIDSSEKRYKALQEILRMFYRVGVAKAYLHVDEDYTKTQEVLWVY